mmetsp:Transcript_32314/g.52006  ORF Transcript_32314/g.52006 Transcript_32314/m.52006 type:complete len:245 (+) Transcript_32314:372-1106(+)
MPTRACWQHECGPSTCSTLPMRPPSCSTSASRSRTGAARPLMWLFDLITRTLGSDCGSCARRCPMSASRCCFAGQMRWATRPIPTTSSRSSSAWLARMGWTFSASLTASTMWRRCRLQLTRCASTTRLQTSRCALQAIFSARKRRSTRWTTTRSLQSSALLQGPICSRSRTWLACSGLDMQVHWSTPFAQSPTCPSTSTRTTPPRPSWRHCMPWPMLAATSWMHAWLRWQTRPASPRSTPSAQP